LDAKRVFHFIGNTFHSNKYSARYNQSDSEINGKFPLILANFNQGFKGFNIVCKIRRFWIYWLSITSLVEFLHSHTRTVQI